MLSVSLCNIFLSFLLIHADCWLFTQPTEGPCPRSSSPRWTFLDFRVSHFSSTITCTPCPFVLLGMHLLYARLYSCWCWDSTRNDIAKFSGRGYYYQLNSKIYVLMLTIFERTIKLRRRDPALNIYMTDKLIATYYIAKIDDLMHTLKQPPYPDSSLLYTRSRATSNPNCDLELLLCVKNSYFFPIRNILHSMRLFVSVGRFNVNADSNSGLVRSLLS